MPSIRPTSEAGSNEKRTTFRPPWVKDGPNPLPMPPTNPWLQQAKQSKEAKNSTGPPSKPPKDPKKEKEIKIQIEKEKGPEPKASSGKERETEVPVQRVHEDVPKKTENSPRRNVKNEPGVKKVEVRPKSEGKAMESQVVPPPQPPAMPQPPVQSPKATPPPPMAPPPPPPPMKQDKKPPTKPVSKDKAIKLESLRSRPRRRPDWTDMMKEVETGIKLKHVKCNDRSAPVLPETKAKGQFVYDSEKHTAHNILLKEIQSGIHLKKVKTNDRSKPILEGLRKFRRQMTIEEIITKSASVADVVAVAAQPDELDDIDKVRDDLQSTKQMLALELRNKEALERENKRLLARLANLETELEKDKLTRTLQTEGNTKQNRTAEDDKLINQLKEEASESANMTKEMEDKYHKTAEELDLTRAKLESAWLKNSQLEMELKTKGNYNANLPLTKQMSTKKMPSSSADKKYTPGATIERLDSESATESETEDEDADETNDTVATQEEREFRLLTHKLKSMKEKKTSATNEKRTLKSQLSKLSRVLKEEKKKYKLLQKEVEKMANLMKDVEGETDEDDTEEEEDEEEEEEEETETESDETTEQEDSDSELPESSNHQDKVKHFNKRIKVYETLLTRAKKGNYLLKANIERRQDDVNRQKEMSLALQEDLNAVLSELG